MRYSLKCPANVLRKSTTSCADAPDRHVGHVARLHRHGELAIGSEAIIHCMLTMEGRASTMDVSLVGARFRPSMP
jgi:hypothetical protein